MPRSMVDDLHAQALHRAHELCQETPRGRALRLDAKEYGGVIFDPLPELLLLVASEGGVLSLELFLGGLGNPFLGLLVVVRDGKSKREGRDDGRKEDGQDDGGVEVDADDAAVDRKYRNDKGELSLGRHGEAGDEAVAQVDVREALGLVEVWNDKTRKDLAQEGDAEHQALPDDGAVAKVADGDLEADGGREEDAHQPLEDALELADEDVMEVVAAAEGQAGDEGAHEEAGLGVVGGGHQAEEEAEHDGQLDRGAFLLGPHLGQHVPIEQAGEPRQRKVSAQTQEQKGRYDRNDEIRHADGTGQGREEGQYDEGDHVVDDGGADDELPDGGVDDLALPEDVHGDAQRRRAEAAAGGDGALGVDAQGEGDAYADADGQDGTDDGNDQAAGADELQHGNVDVDAGLEDQQDQANLSQHNERLRIGHVVRHGRPQYDPRKDLPDQAGHLEDPLRERPHDVDEGEEEDGGVQVGEGDVDAELGMVLLVTSAEGVVRHVAGSVDFGLFGQEARIRTRTVLIIGTERTAAEAAEDVGHHVPKERLGFERHVVY
mmetsp:Transcript_18416/g.43657  ORF Transcript_18416/g.43657 Transcript_18416/m.43657 type:complete len:547 (-) Transcript_18416:89-1729(-)